MTVDAIESLAMQGLPMPGGLDLAQQLLFQGFRKLYAYAGQYGMDQEQGAREKASLLREYERAETQLRRAREVLLNHGEMWKRIESAGIDFAKDRTVENAIRFHDAVYGCKMKEEVG